MPADDSLVAVVQTARRFAARHIAPAADALDHGEEGFPADTYAHGVAAGFDRIALPEALGGAGFSLPALGSLVAELAHTCAGHALVFGVQAATLRSLAAVAGADLDAVLAAARPVAPCLPEPDAAGDFTPTVAATPAGAGRVLLTGRAGLALGGGPAAGWILVFAAGDDGAPVASLLPTTLTVDALTVGPPERALGLRALTLSDVVLTRCDAAPLATGDAARALHRALLADLCRVVAGAAAGLARSAAERALAYAQERYQGGRLLVEHAALQTLLGALAADAELATAAADRAWLRPNDDRAALAAKIAATEGAVRVATDAVQLLGGYGYMREFGLEKAMRDAAVLSLVPLTNHRARLRLSGG